LGTPLPYCSAIIDEKAKSVTANYLYAQADGTAINTEEKVDQYGERSWTITLPPGKPVLLSWIFELPFTPVERKAVNVALAGVKDILIIPAAPKLPQEPTAKRPH
jgi:hypothetical protein